MLLWEEKVAVEPMTDYSFSCYASDISDADNLFGTIALEIDDVRSKPIIIEDLFSWKWIEMHIKTGTQKYVMLKVWRDVLPYGAEGAAALGLDDIHFTPFTSK